MSLTQSVKYLNISRLDPNIYWAEAYNLIRGSFGDYGRGEWDWGFFIQSKPQCLGEVIAGWS